MRLRPRALAGLSALRPLIAMAISGASLGCATRAVEPQDVVCTPTDGYACVSGGDCSEGVFVDAPGSEFVRIKLASRKMNLPGRTAPITKAVPSDGNVVIQGTESGYGWSVTVNATSGGFVATFAGPASAVVVFGTCRVDGHEPQE